MLDRNNHVSGVTPLDGTTDGRCFNNAAYVVALSEAGTAPKRLPETCYDLLNNVNAARDKHPNDPKALRRAVGKTLMATSEAQCGSYRRFLTQFHGNVRSTFGISAQVAAIVATLATGSAGPWFAGASAALGGAGGTLNDAHFYDQALPAITAAFEKRRAERKEGIDKKLDEADDDYNVSDILNSVLEYHNDCSLDAGLDELTESLKEPTSIGPEDVEKIVEQQRKNREALRNLLKAEAAKDNEAVKETAPPDDVNKQ